MGVAVSLLRVLGLPCRPVTCYDTAMTSKGKIDRYFTPEGRLLHELEIDNTWYRRGREREREREKQRELASVTHAAIGHTTHGVSVGCDVTNSRWAMMAGRWWPWRLTSTYTASGPALSWH